MSVTVYDDYDSAINDVFFDNFHPDDWDYVLVGDDWSHVEHLAEKLKVFKYDIKFIGDQVWAVTYHS